MTSPRSVHGGVRPRWECTARTARIARWRAAVATLDAEPRSPRLLSGRDCAMVRHDRRAPSDETDPDFCKHIMLSDSYWGMIHSSTICVHTYIQTYVKVVMKGWSASKARILGPWRMMLAITKGWTENTKIVMTT